MTRVSLQQIRCPQVSELIQSIQSTGDDGIQCQGRDVINRLEEEFRLRTGCTSPSLILITPSSLSPEQALGHTN